MEAREALAWLARAARRGNAAGALIRCGDALLLQRKTEGYPYHTMVGGLCIFGGNKEASDKLARETLLRELKEEMPEAWYEEIRSSLKPYARYVVYASEEVMIPKPFSYAFPVCIYSATIPRTLLEHGEVSEGAFELVPFAKLPKERFCWGYDVVVRDYLVDHAKDVIGSIPFRNDYIKCAIERLANTTDLGDPWLSQDEH